MSKKRKNVTKNIEDIPTHLGHSVSVYQYLNLLGMKGEEFGEVWRNNVQLKEHEYVTIGETVMLVPGHRKQSAGIIP